MERKIGRTSRSEADRYLKRANLQYKVIGNN